MTTAEYDRALATREGWLAALSGLVLSCGPFMDIPPVAKMTSIVSAFGCAQVGRTRRKAIESAELALQDQAVIHRQVRIEQSKLDAMRQNPGVLLPMNASLNQAALGQSEAELIDLAHEFAMKPFHLWVSSTTGTGKTVFMNAVTYEILQAYPSEAIHIIDAKGSSWCGLCKISERYMYVSRPELVPDTFKRLDSFVNIMLRRQKQRMAQGGRWKDTKPDPVFLIVEEFNSLRGILQEVDANSPGRGKSKLEDKFTRVIRRIISQGREENIWLIITGQTSRVEVMKLNTGDTKNMVFACFARNHTYESIEDAISSKTLIAPPSKPPLQQFLQRHKETHREGFQIPLVLTNFKGWRYCQLPDYSETEAIDLFPETENPWAVEVLQSVNLKVDKLSEKEANLRQEFGLFKVACDEEILTVGFLAWLRNESEETQKQYAALIDYAMRNSGTHKTRDLMANNTTMRQIQGAERIRDMFKKLLRYSIGVSEGSGNQLRWGLNKAE